VSGRLVEGNTLVNIPGSIVFVLRHRIEDKSAWTGEFQDDSGCSADAAHSDIGSRGHSVDICIGASKKLPAGNRNRNAPIYVRHYFLIYEIGDGGVRLEMTPDSISNI